jgi:hypothetical protein
MLKQNGHWLSIMLLSIALMGFKPNAVKLDRKHPDYVRAVLINKITPYIYWQSSDFSAPDSPIKLCIVESETQTIEKIWPYLNLLSSRKSGNRSYVVKDVSRFKQEPERLPEDCHIFYFAQLSQNHSRQLVTKAKQTSILTIADSLEELNDGAMMAFIEERGKMKIYVNTEAISSSSLKIKSSLLRIAKKI